MQRLDMIGRKPEHARIKPLGLIENAAALQLEPALYRRCHRMAFLDRQDRAGVAGILIWSRKNACGADQAGHVFFDNPDGLKRTGSLRRT